MEKENKKKRGGGEDALAEGVGPKSSQQPISKHRRPLPLVHLAGPRVRVVRVLGALNAGLGGEKKTQEGVMLNGWVKNKIGTF